MVEGMGIWSISDPFDQPFKARLAAQELAPLATKILVAFVTNKFYFCRMAKKSSFDLQDFLPYMLNQAAEASSADFQAYYKDRYGMLRTEWRVLFHLGRYGKMTAKEICSRAKIHKTKVSRAVRALEEKKLLSRTALESDRRNDLLTLTRQGNEVFDDLAKAAEDYDKKLSEPFSAEEQAILKSCLARIAKL